MSIKEVVVLLWGDNSDSYSNSNDNSNDNKNGQEKFLVAYIVPVSGKMVDKSQLKKYLSGFFPEYMIPSYFVMLEELPLKPNGKLNKSELPEPETDIEGSGMGNRRERTYKAPVTETEEKLVKIWSEILNLEADKIGIEDDFFEIGGHSLRGMNLVSKVHKVFQKDITLMQVFEKPYIRDLAGLLDKEEERGFLSISQVEKREYYALSSAQRRIFILHSMEDEKTTGYNTPRVMTVKGKLDVEGMEEAFRKLIQRHESLRTSFHLINEEPVQIIHANVDFGVDYQEGGGLDMVGGSISIEERIQQFMKPFDISVAPLLRVSLVKTGEDCFLLLADLHHIIKDGTSMGIMIDDFFSLLGAYKRINFCQFLRISGGN